MKEENYISVVKLCSLYGLEVSFFNELTEIGLVELTNVKQTLCLHKKHITNFEKIIRIHHELNVNIEGVDIIFNLLNKVNSLQSELSLLRERLHLYEHN